MTFAGLDHRSVLTEAAVTDRELGRGAYTTVLELEYDGQKYAGKKIHATLLDLEHKKVFSYRGYVVDRFVEECRFLSQFDHPNIVQFVGIYFCRGDGLPILVTELLPTNLGACIERHGLLPKDIAYSLLHDVALGLHYLHSRSPPIMHGDLAAGNILLTSKMSAKICDFGSAARSSDTNTRRLSPSPNFAIVHMPPETFAIYPSILYDTSVDIFSYGILMIFTFSGKYPKQLKPPTYYSQGVHCGRTEAERREKYLQAISNDHPAMKLILQCITNDPKQRPIATEITQQIKRICQYDGRYLIVHI